MSNPRRPWYLRLQWLILAGMLLGIGAGLLGVATGAQSTVVAVSDPIGTIFIDLLKMLMVPLVFTSIVTGVTNLGDVRRLGRIGGRTILYYLATTALAVVVGLMLVSTIRPGATDDATAEGVVELVRRPAPTAAPAEGQALVSVVHAVGDRARLDVATADGPTWLRGLGFRDSSRFDDFPAGRTSLEIRDSAAAPGAEPLATVPLELAPGDAYVVLLRGRVSDGSVKAQLIPLDGSGGTVWFVHAAASIPPVHLLDESGRSVTATPPGSAAHEYGAPPVPLTLQGGGSSVSVSRGDRVLARLSAERVTPGLFILMGRPLPTEPKALVDILTGIVPDNIFDALARSDVLSIIFFALLFGLALAVSGEAGAPVTSFMDSAFHVVMKLTGAVMWTAPLGVAALLAKTMAEMGPDVLGRLLAYMGTVLGGLAIHAFVTLPLLLMIVGRTSPFGFAKAMSRALLTAFSTSSSSASLPVTLDCIETKAGVSNRVASFVLPLGATVNMDGTALYEAVAALFIAQLYQIDLSFGEAVVVFVTATLAAIGAAGVPSAGLVTMVLVLRAVGLPEDGIGLIVAVDRVLDMCRTTVNVWGDAVGARIIAGMEGDVVVVDEDGG